MEERYFQPATLVKVTLVHECFWSLKLHKFSLLTGKTERYMSSYELHDFFPMVFPDSIFCILKKY